MNDKTTENYYTMLHENVCVQFFITPGDVHSVVTQYLSYTKQVNPSNNR